MSDFLDKISGMLDEDELNEIGEIEVAIGEYIDAHEEEDIKYFKCPHCDMTLENQRRYDSDVENQNEFWCHKCGITYIIEGDKIIEEENPFEEVEEVEEEEYEKALPEVPCLSSTSLLPKIKDEVFYPISKHFKNTLKSVLSCRADD